MTKNRNIVHTLAYNLPSQVELAVTDLFEKNDKKDFTHIIVDLGYPLQLGDQIPEDIERAKRENSVFLMDLCEKNRSIYFKAENIGVSQNWTQVAHELKVGAGDTMICCDPDERVHSMGWVKALGDVMRASDDRYGWISLAMPEHLNILQPFPDKYREKIFADHRVWEIQGSLNWAQGAMSGKLIEQLGEIPFLKEYPKYGHIETATMQRMKPLGYSWSMLPDFTVSHTDEVPLYRAWKDQIIFRIKEHGQLDFEQWLQMRKEGRI